METFEWSVNTFKGLKEEWKAEIKKQKLISVNKNWIPTNKIGPLLTKLDPYKQNWSPANKIGPLQTKLYLWKLWKIEFLQTGKILDLAQILI